MLFFADKKWRVLKRPSGVKWKLLQVVVRQELGSAKCDDPVQGQYFVLVNNSTSQGDVLLPGHLAVVRRR